MKQRLIAYGEAVMDIAALSLAGFGLYWCGIFGRPTAADLALSVSVYALISAYKIKRGVKP